MKKWVLFLGAVAAVGATAVVVAVAMQRARAVGELNQIPQIIADCRERLRRIEAELHQIGPAADPAA